MSQLTIFAVLEGSVTYLKRARYFLLDMVDFARVEQLVGMIEIESVCAHRIISRVHLCEDR